MYTRYAIFPVDEFLGLHNLSAMGMVVVFVALVLSLRRLVDSMPNLFVVLGYVYVGIIVVLAVFFVTGYYNLTAVELVAAVLVFSWIILLLRNISAIEHAPLPEGGRGRGGTDVPASD